MQRDRWILILSVSQELEEMWSLKRQPWILQSLMALGGRQRLVGPAGVGGRGALGSEVGGGAASWGRVVSSGGVTD